MTTEHDTIIISEVDSDVDVEEVRKIRNECKDFMTNYNSTITEEEQKSWYKNLDKEKNKLFLMHVAYHGVAIVTIGFGYVYHKDGITYLTGALREGYRGKGIGKTLFSFLTEKGKQFDGPIRLEVLHENTRAKKLYENLGFKPISTTNKMSIMEFVDDRLV